MKIALVLDRFDRNHGGLENWAWQWSRWLLDHGHSVHVVASKGCKYFDSDRFVLTELGFAQSRLALAECFATYLDRIDSDLIHDLGVGWRYDIVQPQFGTRLADDQRNLRSLDLSRRLFARLSIERQKRLADVRTLERRQYVNHPGRVVAVSAMTRDDLTRWHRLPDGKITVIHNGVDGGAFRPPTPERRRQLRRNNGLDQHIVLLFAAHNFRLKGLATVLRALKRLENPRFHLVVTGHEHPRKYRRLSGRLGVDSQVTFAGFLPDIRDAYAMADAFVQPTFYDPCGLAILEAAASGIAVVTSHFNGASELFRNGESASIIANPEDDTEAARHINALIDSAYRARIAAGGLAVASRATMERSFSLLFDLCCQTAHEKSGQSCRD